jgi:hypothetical protein
MNDKKTLLIVDDDIAHRTMLRVIFLHLSAERCDW